MSHFSSVKTQLRDLVLLERALRDLGYQPSTGTVAARGWNGRTMPVDLVVPMYNGYDLGFKQVGDELEVVVDEWGFREDLTELLGRVKQRYAYQLCVAQAEAQGFKVTGTEEQADGSIRLLVERYQ